MMAAGIAMVSVAPFAFLGSAIVGIQKAACGVSDIDSSGTFIDSRCDRYDPAMYGLLLSGVVLVGAGIPLIVIGAKQVPVSENSEDEMAILPWVSRDGAGAVVRWRM
jgi:hypothetical protein